MSDLIQPAAGMAPGMGGDPMMGTMAPPDPTAGNTFMNREKPEPPDQVKKLVQRWCARVRRAKKHWKPEFTRIRENMKFAHGEQWPDPPKNGERDDRYVVNVCLRHIQQRTAELYPTNPTMKVKKKEKLIALVWDGSAQQLMMAQQSGMMMGAYGMPPDPQSAAILQDAMMVKQWDQLTERIGKTLKLLYDYNIEEQAHSFKTSMKMTIRRAIVAGVSYVRLGFQRAMVMRPDIERRISDMSERLANIERLAGDLADGEIEPDSADAESLRIAIQTLMAEGQVVVREGLTFDYPDTIAIIPDPKVRSLRGFLGADWVAQEYLLFPDEIEEIYMVDVSAGYTAYDADGNSTDTTDHTYAGGTSDEEQDDTTKRACVWEIFNRKDGTCYVVCDGYSDWLQQPGPPDAETERFYPWFAMVMNEGYSEKCVYPPSDIDLMRDMQLELNRARQGLREHRRSNRPKVAVAAGMLEEPDKEKLKNHPVNALIELNALAPGQKIDDVLQPIQMPPIDPAVYDTSGTFEDLLRVLGSDQADQGTTSGATATEVSVAEFSQNTDTSSVVDDLNELLTDLGRSASEILLMNVSPQIVQKVVGPGAVWPELDRQTIAENVWLEVDVGAMGPPNRQQDVQMLSQIIPLLQRVPGISTEWMARELIRRMGDDIDLTEAFVEGLPSIEALNQMAAHPPTPPGEAPEGEEGGGAGQGDDKGGGAGKGPPRPPGPGADPNSQGNLGPNNAPAANPPGSIGPRPPQLQVFGANGNAPGTGGGLPRAATRAPGMPTP